MGQLKIAVIGGGASGMMAAVTAAKNGAEVCIFERNDRLGKKILATGNGKCNFSNMDLSKECYFCDDEDFLGSVISTFQSQDIISFFEHAGMLIKDRNHYLYPATEQASTVLDIFRILLKQEKVTVKTEEKIDNIAWNQEKKMFMVNSSKGQHFFHKVVLSMGGKASPKTGSDGNGLSIAQSYGHSIIPVVPALVQLRCEESYLKSIAGVRLDAIIKLTIDSKETVMERGELQFTDYGISGIVVFQLSRIAAYGILEKKNVKVYIDCLPSFSDLQYDELVRERKELCKEAETIEEFFTGLIHKKLLLLYIKLAGLKPEDKYKKADPSKIDMVFTYCKKFRLQVSGTNSFDQAQVSAGGIPLHEVTKNLESKMRTGLYLTGEMLNVDGKCGGYNLHWAWASGYLAGCSATNPK
ncbi:MAG TPA: aminoacetone oxidase family FAD-binding enzyme [Lachnospiraceae bacterium]|nr:aminoacetone oxidase family FAD-binding enzyme [Lachnospiraceae bacterium]